MLRKLASRHITTDLATKDGHYENLKLRGDYCIPSLFRFAQYSQSAQDRRRQVRQGGLTLRSCLSSTDLRFKASYSVLFSVATCTAKHRSSARRDSSMSSRAVSSLLARTFCNSKVSRRISASGGDDLDAEDNEGVASGCSFFFVVVLVMVASAVHLHRSLPHCRQPGQRVRGMMLSQSINALVWMLSSRECDT